VAEGGGEEHMAGVHTGTPDVFLSYASQDSAVAEAVCEALEQAGVRCWIAPRDVTPGTFYADEIVHAIDAVKAIVLILSQNAAASPHVLREVERATSKRHPVVSLRIDRASLPAGLEYFLNTSQWLDASGGDTARAMPKLVAALCLATDKPAATNATIVATPAGGSSRTSYPDSDGPRRRIAIVVGSLLTVAIGGFAAYRLRLPEHRIVAPPVVAVATATPAAPAASSIPERSVAVLPFVDMSEKKDQEYFSDGLSEELIDMLTKVPDLRVPARTSSFYFKDKPTKIPDIAKELGVAHVLEGSVRKSGNHLRVTAQLVRADTGYHLWSETYDRKLDDIFKVQDDIADAVVKALKISLLAAQVSRVPATKNMEAYTLLLKANYFLTRAGGTKDDMEKATDYYQQAVRLDPTSAPAWAGLSRGLAELTYTQPWKQVRQGAFDAANRALSLDPRLADAHIALGKNDFYDWDWENAEAQFKEGRALEPTNYSAFLLSGQLASTLGHTTEALQYFQEASARDPLNWNPYSNIGFEYESRGRFPEAEAAFRKAEQLAPTISFASEIGFIQLREGGDSAAALAEINREDDESLRAYYLAASYAFLGRRADADATLARYQKEHEANHPYNMARLHAWRAESNEAFEWLDRAYQQHDDNLHWIKTDRSFENFRSDPRYKAFLRKMNLPE